MASFKPYFRAIFDRFGYPLKNGAKVPAEELSATEKRLGVPIPRAVRDYYLVAGRERRFNTCHNRLLPPKGWSIDKKNLIFMEENQTVVWWAVSTRNPRSNDPAVFQGVNDEPITWVREHRRFSVFLALMLHYQAVSGGFRHLGSAAAPDNIHEKLKHGWNYVGEVNQVWAFSRQDQVVCVTPGGGLLFQPAMMLLAGGKAKRDLQSIGESLSVTLDTD
jgi:hypothetical protein